MRLKKCRSGIHIPQVVMQGVVGYKCFSTFEKQCKPHHFLESRMFHRTLLASNAPFRTNLFIDEQFMEGGKTQLQMSVTQAML